MFNSVDKLGLDLGVLVRQRQDIAGPFATVPEARHLDLMQIDAFQRLVEECVAESQGRSLPKPR